MFKVTQPVLYHNFATYSFLKEGIDLVPFSPGSVLRASYIYMILAVCKRCLALTCISN
jgi:hypothetical protein